MTHTYIIIDDNRVSQEMTLALAKRFPSLQLAGVANNYEEGLNLILEYNPQLVFLEIDPDDKESKLSLALINELYRYLTVIPKIIVTTGMTALAYEAIRYEVFDYLIKPIEIHALRRTLLKLTKSADVASTTDLNIGTIEELKVDDAVDRAIVLDDIDNPSAIITESTTDISPINGSVNSLAEKPLIICVKSYGDYRFIGAKDISYLKADNNSTDIHLSNGEMITAFKTLKHFEQLLVKPFVRIHNSYIVNIDYVSRIHTGNSVCYIKGSTTKLPFSKSYKENIDEVIHFISTGNYLEF